MIEVLPAILADDAAMLRERLSFSGFWTDGMTAHVDILDGSMFDASCFCDPSAVALQPPPSPPWKGGGFPSAIELHCMVQNPLPIIEQWKQLVPQTLRAIVHAEIDRPLDPILAHIRELHLETGVAFCPETRTIMLEALMSMPDRVLMMGIRPGASGRPFLGEEILAKIRRLHREYPSLHISVDGGITSENAPVIVEAGASSLVAASAVWNTPNPHQSYEHLVHRAMLHDHSRI
jgi:ribulose-phosphate 3-epimerase